MEVAILREDKDMLEVEFTGEGHTLCNLLRKKLWEQKDIKSSSYQIKHPQVSEPVILVQASKPRKALLAAIDAAKADIAALRAKVAKL